MSAWQDAPDASGMWWVRREDDRDVVLQVDVGDDGVWINRGGEGWCSGAEYPGAKWCRVVTPERVEALESALRDVVDAYELEDTDRPCARYAVAVLLGATVAGERGSR